MIKFLFPVVMVFFITIASFPLFNNKKTKYPPNFPVTCIEYFDKFYVYIKKMEDSKRFDKETLSAFNWLRNSQISKIIKSHSTHDKTNGEKYNCLFPNPDFFYAIDNADNLTQDELENILSTKHIKELYILNKTRLRPVFSRF